MRTGTDYLASLNEGRRVFVDGAAVDHVQSHPAFAGVSRTVASLYDTAADPANDMIFTASETGKQSKQGLHDSEVAPGSRGAATRHTDVGRHHLRASSDAAPIMWVASLRASRAPPISSTKTIASLAKT